MLDINICIYTINNKPMQVFEKFNQSRLGDIGISSISASELVFGVERSGSQRNKQALERFLAPLEILAFSEDAIWHYGRIRQHLPTFAEPRHAYWLFGYANSIACSKCECDTSYKQC